MDKGFRASDASGPLPTPKNLGGVGKVVLRIPLFGQTQMLSGACRKELQPLIIVNFREAHPRNSVAQKRPFDLVVSPVWSIFVCYPFISGNKDKERLGGPESTDGPHGFDGWLSNCSHRTIQAPKEPDH